MTPCICHSSGIWILYSTHSSVCVNLWPRNGQKDLFVLIVFSMFAWNTKCRGDLARFIFCLIHSYFITMRTVEQRSIATIRMDLADVRSKRQEANEAFQCQTRQWMERQDELQERLTNRQCGTHIFLHAFEDHSSNTPSSVIFKQAKLCSYEYNVDINKFQTNLVTLQSKDITKHFHKQMNHLKEESTVTQIEVLNDISRVHAEIASLKQALVLATTLATPTRVDDDPKILLDNKQRSCHHSVLSEFKSALEAERAPKKQFSILMQAQSILWNVSDQRIPTNFKCSNPPARVT